MHTLGYIRPKWEAILLTSHGCNLKKSLGNFHVCIYPGNISSIYKGLIGKLYLDLFYQIDWQVEVSKLNYIWPNKLALKIKQLTDQTTKSLRIIGQTFSQCLKINMLILSEMWSDYWILILVQSNVVVVWPIHPWMLKTTSH